MGMDYYVLNASGEPVPEPDLLTWARWFETNDRSVGRTQIGEVLVSTVFLGADHNWHGGPPILYETMVFGLPGNEEQQWRYNTRAQALASHDQIVACVRDGRHLVVE